MAADLAASSVERERAKSILRDAETASAGAFEALVLLVNEITGGQSRPKAEAKNVTTFRAVGEEWTDGELHERFPDQVDEIAHDINKLRIERHIYPVLGDLPIREVTRANCDDVMRRLPETLKSRRHVAALVNRILNLAELAGYIDRNPLPRGWLPKPLPKKLWAVLYPKEDRALLAAVPSEGKPGVPLCYRVLYGFLHREGMRKGEALALRWRDLDLENGVVELDKNKTDHARGWPLDPGVAEALKAWRKLSGNPDGDTLVFVDEAGDGLRAPHIAKLLRDHMQAAGLTRDALFSQGTLRGRFGLHSFRRSFITRSLSLGKGEDWVRRRSGHKSDQLLRYRQHASGLAELALGEVDNLALAIPELAQDMGQRVGQNEPARPYKAPVSNRNDPRFSDALKRQIAGFRNQGTLEPGRSQPRSEAVALRGLAEREHAPDFE
jgi:integrase